ncbi:apolipoprotein N-acyltransferase [Alteromonas aestuariivivens]|uniref:Apolipoprotein N-acyltransferase n=1 Tax=Alteromonas aestuariivivens TaxID=1938339 RepID=A0A3D8M4A3_9ALTE|nr:apolipoprotein N-acyltransferase [Alteromonas aestuariivivens]RDV24573.1 apolipoprotein N-acyltransferase [Alteromonas aestuariivivens]
MLSGVSLTFAYAPFNAWPVTFLATAVALRQLAGIPHQGFRLGWLFGLGWFGAGISWVHVSIADFGGLPLIASVGLMLLLCGYLALYPAIAFYCLKRAFPPRLWPLALPFLWFVTEWLRSWMLSGFPWLSLGYSQIDSPLGGWAPLIGESGITALIIALSAALACWPLRQKPVAVAALFTICFSSGWVANQRNWTQAADTHEVAMVQGNIAQSLRWVPEQDGPTMEKYRRLTQPLWSSDLIVWPEAAIPRVEPLAQEFLRSLDQEAVEHNSALISGIVNYNMESREVWNNLLVLGKQSPDNPHPGYHYFHNNRYAKHHLLPIGEFVPFEDWLRPLAPLFDLPMSSFSRGDFQQTNLLANGIRLAPAICFEIAFPGQLAANVHDDTDMIITVSNDAWFGHSHGPAQHLQIARMRAKELGKPVIRATNNGISAFIDARGDIIARLPQFEAATLSAPLTSTLGHTPFRNWGMLATLLLTLSLFLCAMLLEHNPLSKSGKATQAE